jgi:hypothetical protein
VPYPATHINRHCSAPSYTNVNESVRFFIFIYLYLLIYIYIYLYLFIFCYRYSYLASRSWAVVSRWLSLSKIGGSSTSGCFSMLIAKSLLAVIG